MKKKQQLLLLEDVYGLGRKGEIVQTLPGYFRNYLLPQKKAVQVHAHTLRMQKKLQQERLKQAAIDRVESEKLAASLKDLCLKISVKTDTEGKLYGSVTTADIMGLLAKENVAIDKKCIKLLRPIKSLGIHQLKLNLQEDVEACIAIEVLPEHPIKKTNEKTPSNQDDTEEKQSQEKQPE